MTAEPNPRQARLIITQRGRRVLRWIVSPLESVALFASGAQHDVLKHAPSDRTWFSVLGTFVILTSIVAGLAAFVTTGFILNGNVTVGVTEVLIGALWGTIIFVFDRAIVKAPLLPVEFNPRILGMLWNPSGDIRAYVEDGEGKPVQLITLRWSALPKAFIILLPRLVVAICASLIFAETLAFVYFQKDLEPRVESLVISQRSQVEASVQQQYQDAVSSKQEQIANLESSLDAERPTIAELEEKLPGLQENSTKMATDRDLLKFLRGQEAAGIVATGVLSNGTEVSSSDDPSRGFRWDTFDELVRDYEALASNANDALLEATSSIDSRKQALRSNPAVAALYLELEALKPTDIGTFDAAGFQGVGIRRLALDQYTHDANPLTLEVDETEPCAAGDPLCALVTWLIPPTPSAPQVRAFLFGLIAIELMPFFIKIAFVVRRRRPYDTLVGVKEVVSSAESATQMSTYLAAYGMAIEQAGRERRAMRTGEAAEYIIVRAEKNASATSRNSRWRPVRHWAERWKDRLRVGTVDPERRPPADVEAKTDK